MQAPDKIWLHPITEDNFQDVWFTYEEDGDVEYVRATALAGAQAEIARLRRALQDIAGMRASYGSAEDTIRSMAHIADTALNSTPQ